MEPGIKQISKEEFEQKISQADACRGCSFNHIDEEGGNYCGIASFTNEKTCPRTGGKF